MPSDTDAGTTRVLPTATSRTVSSVELVVVDGPDRGRRLQVEQGSARIGTGRGNELCLTDRSVSRVHCEVVPRPNGVALRDLGSTNGTFVDGWRIRDADLPPQASIRLGGTTLRATLGAGSTVPLSPHAGFGGAVGQSAEMRSVFAVLERAAASDVTVLLLGETGTGKDVVAQALHEASRRAAAPLVTVDCGAMPESLMESELFGHVRGAFTNALGDRRGAFEEADGGTLFFDEIGELPLTLQPKLLRALESRQVRRVGSNSSKTVDVRVIAATNRSLAQCVNDGSFREDLYYRLAVLEIELPPLRTRREDIPLLAQIFVERFTGSPGEVPAEVLSAMMTRSWPGNVRELRNFVERSVCVGWSAPAERPGAAAPVRPGGASLLSGEVGARLERLFALQLKEARSLWTEQFESIYVRALLERAGGNVTHAAELAGVSRRFFQRTMARLGMRTTDSDP